MYDTILVPIDFSHEDVGIKAVRIAKNLVNKGGKIILVNVIVDIPAYALAYMPPDISADSGKMALEHLHKIAKDEEIGNNVEVHTGQPASSILDVAESHDTDLIIVASHRPGISDYFLGSTAARIVRYAKCPVLVDR